MRIAPLAAVIAAAACRGPAASAPGASPGIVTCPPAANVYVVTWRDETPAGWRLPLDARDDAPPGAPIYRTLTDAEATTAGLPPVPPAVWIYRLDHPEQPPCRAVPVRGYVAVADEGPPHSIRGAELAVDASCPPAEPGAVAYALASVLPPLACTLSTPVAAAARLPIEDASGWAAPTQATGPIPDELASVLPAPPCEPPACEALWDIRRVDVAGRPVAWEAQQSWVRPTAADDACAWARDDHFAVYTQGPGGAVHEVPAGAPPQGLVGVFADAAGPHVLVTEEAGTYAAFDLGIEGEPTPGRQLQWAFPNEETYSPRSLAPYCGP